MTDDDKRALHPATVSEIEDTLSFALRYDGRKRVHTADNVMARVTAERLTRYLQQSGYVLMRRAPPGARSTSGHKHPHEG